MNFTDIDYVELYVGNSYQAMRYLSAAFGFTPIAYCGLEISALSCRAKNHGQEELYEYQHYFYVY